MCSGKCRDSRPGDLISWNFTKKEFTAYETKKNRYVRGKGILVGEFTAMQVANGTDRVLAEQKMKETGLRCINTEMVGKDGNWTAMRVYVCRDEDCKDKPRKELQKLSSLSFDIVEVFESLLDDKDISIPCADKDEEKNRKKSNARIYGTEYGDLITAVSEILEGLEKD